MKAVREVHPGVFSFDLFTPKQCVALLKKIDKQRDGESPNSMNKYGATLGGSLRPFLAGLLGKYIAPISKEHYPEIGALKKRPYAFVVDYEVGKQRSLASHYDQSAVTLNVCLSDDFGGGGLVFYKGDKVEFGYEHALGRAVVHRGAHVHRAKPITSGTRSNLILWTAEKKR